MITRSTGRPCTCLDGTCPQCNGRGYYPCTLALGHTGAACPFCGGTAQRQCEWCFGSGQHTLCGGTGVVAVATRGGLEVWPMLSSAPMENAELV
jgi:hypothetical protein